MTIVGKQLGIEPPPFEDLPLPARTEREVAADAVWALIAAGLILKSTPMLALCQATGLALDDLRVASVRAGRRAAGRPLQFRRDRWPVRSPLPPEGYLPDRAPRRGDRRLPDPPPSTRLTDRGRRGAADAVFAAWRARGNLTCTRCGNLIESGGDAEIEAAHHAGGCP